MQHHAKSRSTLDLGTPAERLKYNKSYYFMIKKTLDELLLHRPPESDAQFFRDYQ